MCWLLHRWGSWTVYEEEGQATTGWLHPAGSGQTVHYAETRQRRHCLRCGKAQDEWLKSGYDPLMRTVPR